MPKICTVGLFCCDKFEETPNKKVSDLSKLSKPYFKCNINFFNLNIIKLQRRVKRRWEGPGGDFCKISESFRYPSLPPPNSMLTYEPTCWPPPKSKLGVHNVLVTCEVTGGGLFTKAPLKQELIERDGFSDFQLDFNKVDAATKTWDNPFFIG